MSNLTRLLRDLTREMAEDVIMGFELDALGWRPRSEADLARYCYHVAGAVGVMMAIVMGVPRDDSWMLDRACDLGFAFQLANIARDLDEDDKGDRCYLPEAWLAEEDIEPGQHMKPHHRQELADMAARLIRRMEKHEAMARMEQLWTQIMEFGQGIGSVPLDQIQSQLSAFEERRRLQLALAELPADQREVVLLRLEQELSLEQIGQITGVGRETVKSRLRYALDKLRQRLNP